MISTACTKNPNGSINFAAVFTVFLNENCELYINNAAIVETDKDKASKTSKLIDDYL